MDNELDIESEYETAKSTSTFVFGNDIGKDGIATRVKGTLVTEKINIKVATSRERYDEKTSLEYQSTPHTFVRNCYLGVFNLCCYPLTVPLVFIKLLYFSLCCSMGSILPYLALYYKQNGLTPRQIGLLSGARLVIALFCSPILTTISDTFRIRRCMLVFSLFSWLTVFTALGFLPAPERIHACPQKFMHHQKLQSHNSNNDKMHVVQTANSTVNITAYEYDLLRERRAWIYNTEDLHRFFVIVALLVLVGEVFQSPATALLDTGTIQELGAENVEYYGSQRAWGPAGWSLG